MKKKILAVALAAAMTVTSAMTAFAVDVKDTISGDLTVTSFFGEKTDAVELKSGDSYTFKFNNKSNGTNNWENYVMAVTGAIGDEYTGADQEILIIRADNWGWGGGMSDFVAPDQTSGNVLAFESDINFDTFLTEAQAGLDCEITLSREGDTITYDAKIGSYSDKLTATSGVALPDTCYVFFTGENCDLTGFTTTNNNGAAGGDNNTPAGDDNNTPAGDNNNTPAGDNAGAAGGTDAPAGNGNAGGATTGDVAPYAVAVLAVAAAAVVIVLQKKKVTE